MGYPAAPASRSQRILVFLVFTAACLVVGDSFNPPSRQWSARAAEGAIETYRATVSPFFARTHLVTCRFQPTCSLYALEAIERFGTLKGATLAAWRVLRCNPLSKGGKDPVPTRL